MSNKIIISLFIIILFFISFNFISCSKPAPADLCASKTISLTGSATLASGGSTANGAITATATGSTGFTYSINSGSFQPSGTFSNLSVGTYTIKAKDADGCTADKTFTVTALPCPTITITAITTAASSPTAANGSITASAAGSTGLTYNINGGAFQSTGTFAGLIAGSYTVIAKDINGCTGSGIFIVISASCPTITIATVITPAAGPAAANGAISATAAGGVAPYTYSKNGGTTFQTSGNFNNLIAGNYTIISKDVNNCLGTSGNVTITTNCPAITLTSVNGGSDKCINNTGTITMSAVGSSGFMYNINNGPYQVSNIFSGLGAATYTIGVKDVNGCTSTGAATVNVAAAGPNFINVKSLMTTNCAFAGCHGGTSPQNGLDFNDDCTIVTQKLRIKARAVDGIPSIMPASGALSAADKQKIINWINAGGQHSN